MIGVWVRYHMISEEFLEVRSWLFLVLLNLLVCISLENSVIAFVDINECNPSRNDCEQACNNTVGSYLCSCLSGYSLADNKKNCNGKLK